MENKKLTDDELWELSGEDRPITREELGLSEINEDGFYYVQIL